jgi:hypothetical protein
MGLGSHKDFVQLEKVIASQLLKFPPNTNLKLSLPQWQ